MNEFIEDNITESGNVGRDGSTSLGVSTDDTATGKTIDWSREDSFHNVSWDSFLVAFSLNDPVGKVLGLVELLEVTYGVNSGAVLGGVDKVIVTLLSAGSNSKVWSDICELEALAIEN